MKYVQLYLIFLLFLIAQCSPASQSSGSDVALKQLILSKNYTFLAQFAQPVGGRQLPLNTSDYTLTIKNDSLVSYLPYFGQAYVAPINPADGGIQFTSTDFDYVATSTKKGGYTITIRPRAEAKASQLMLTITGSGYASLQVFSPNRQAISFRGVIQKTGR